MTRGRTDIEPDADAGQDARSSGDVTDPADRTLSEVERSERAVYRTALLGWSRYLSEASPRRTLDAAETYGEPLRGRQRATADALEKMPGFDGWLNVRFAHAALAERAGRGRLVDERGEAVELPAVGRLVDALVWMGAVPATTLRGEDEDDRRSPHRGVTDWYRVSVEITWRLFFYAYVPALRGMPGRPLATRPQRSPVGVQLSRDAQVGLRLDDATLLRLLSAVVVEREPTLLLARSRELGRPLVLRRGGRPTRAGMPNLDLAHAVIGLDALVALSETDGVRLGVPAVRMPDMRLAVARLAGTLPSGFEVLERCRPVDCERPVFRRLGWIRASCRALGCDPFAVRDVEAEIRERTHGDYVSTSDPITGPGRTDGEWT